VVDFLFNPDFDSELGPPPFIVCPSNRRSPVAEFSPTHSPCPLAPCPHLVAGAPPSNAPRLFLHSFASPQILRMSFDSVNLQTFIITSAQLRFLFSTTPSPSSFPFFFFPTVHSPSFPPLFIPNARNFSFPIFRVSWLNSTVLPGWIEAPSFAPCSGLPPPPSELRPLPCPSAHPARSPP